MVQYRQICYVLRGFLHKSSRKTQLEAFISFNSDKITFFIKYRAFREIISSVKKNRQETTRRLWKPKSPCFMLENMGFRNLPGTQCIRFRVRNRCRGFTIDGMVPLNPQCLRTVATQTHNAIMHALWVY